MKYSNTLFSILSFLGSILILTSCSNEEEPIIFTGEYKSITLTNSACDDPADNDFVFRVDANNKYCVEEDGTKECFGLTVRVFEDGSYEFVFINQLTRGGFMTSNPTKEVGAYVANGRSIEFCPDDNGQCATMMLNDPGTALLWEIEGPSCRITHTIVKQ